MRRIEVARIAFIDAVDRLLFEKRDIFEKNGFDWDYQFFGGEIGKRESPLQVVIRTSQERLFYYLGDEVVIYFGSYPSELTQDIQAIDHIYVARFPGWAYLPVIGSGMNLISLHPARRLRIPPVYQRILNDLEASLRDPNFLPP